MEQGGNKRKRVCFFGHFGSQNFGNEITLQTILFHIRRLFNPGDTLCVCTDPQALTASQTIQAVPINPIVVGGWNARNPATRLLRRIFVGIPSEVYRWYAAFRMLKGSDVFIIPGTGLLTDAFGLREWGPYNLFKWTVAARLRGCKVLFVSVGAGPIYSRLGKYFVKSALSLAHFRSYRDEASRKCIQSVGLSTNGDRLYPDLVFSLPRAMVPDAGNRQRPRPVVGIGLMEYAGKYSVEKPSPAIYQAYLESLVLFVKWLLEHGYDVRLLIGDGWDRPVVAEFKSLITTRLGAFDEKRILDAPVVSVEQLLSQLAATDIVVATRFHNILFALLLEKPVLSISFHHKCASLMEEMGLKEYCQDINHMDTGRLIEQFQDLARNADKLRPKIRQKLEECRKALDEQYDLLLKTV